MRSLMRQVSSIINTHDSLAPYTQQDYMVEEFALLIVYEL